MNKEEITLATKAELQKKIEDIQNEYENIQSSLKKKWDETLQLVHSSMDKLNKLAEDQQEIKKEINKRDGK